MTTPPDAPTGDPAPRPPTPLHELLGIRLISASGGHSHLELTVRPDHLRSHAILHGGVFAALLDATLGTAAASTAPPGHDVVTMQLNVNFIRPVAQGETLVGRAEVEHAGRRSAVARGELRTAGGALAALASGTFLHLPTGSAQPGALGPLPGTGTP